MTIKVFYKNKNILCDIFNDVENRYHKNGFYCIYLGDNNVVKISQKEIVKIEENGKSIAGFDK